MIQCDLFGRMCVTCVACEEGVFCDGVELLWEDKTCPLLRERDRLNNDIKTLKDTIGNLGKYVRKTENRLKIKRLLLNRFFIRKCNC